VDAHDRSKTPMQPVHGFTAADLYALGDAVKALPGGDDALPSELRERFRDLYSALFSGEVGQTIDRLRGGGGTLLLKLMVSDPKLRAVPWEGMCGPTDADGPLAQSSGLYLARGVVSQQPAVDCEVLGAVRVLAVTPGDEDGALASLRDELEDVISTGELQWLAPVRGPSARWDRLQERLSSKPYPHILHIVCHGRIRDDGQAELLLAPSEDTWTPVEVIASTLAESNTSLRLVYLESCSGADPGALASAAEQLARKGVEAVVAHLWEVDAGAATGLAKQFYRALVRAAGGNLLLALTLARRALYGNQRPEFLCPVLTLRGENPQLFDFEHRRTMAAPSASSAVDLDPRLQPKLQALSRLLSSPSTILIGQFIEDNTLLGRTQIRAELRREIESSGHEPLSQLMQQLELLYEREELKTVVSQVLGEMGLSSKYEAPTNISGLAKLMGPGLVINLIWFPFFEEALAKHHPEREIFMLQPKSPDQFDRMTAYHHGPGENGFHRHRGPLPRFDLQNQIVVIRLYGGLAPRIHSLIGDPVLTDDDYLENLSAINDLPEQLLAFLRQKPLCLAGFSPLAWSHRELLRQLTGRQPLVDGSIAVLGTHTNASERRYWTIEDSQSGRNSLQVIEYNDFQAILAALT